MNIKKPKINSSNTVSFKDTVLNFCANFDKKANSWKDATQEISTLAKTISECIEVPIPNSPISTPAKFNSKFVSFIEDNIDLVNDHDQKQILKDYDSWFNSTLFESSNPADSEEKDIKNLTLTKTKQFSLDCGLFLETINSGKIDNKISLKWHVNNTFSIDEFIESVRAVVAVAEMDLTSNDISRLTAHYNKYSDK